jgi:hypothetical protein
MILKEIMDKDRLKEVLKINAAEITKLIVDAPKKGRWTLLATLRGEYAIKTVEDQYCPKGQDKIKNSHYKFSLTLNKKDLDELLANSKWPKVICKKLLTGIAEEIDRVSWY